MNWRVWTYQYLSADSALTTLTNGAANIKSATAQNHPPKQNERPLLLLKLGGDLERNDPGRHSELQAWIYDNNGSYDRIDAILARLYELLHGIQVPVEGAITIEHRGDSGDLIDPDWGMIMRTATFGLVGVRKDMT